MYELLCRKGQIACIGIIAIKIERIQVNMNTYKGSQWERESLYLRRRMRCRRCSRWMGSQDPLRRILYLRGLIWSGGRQAHLAARRDSEVREDQEVREVQEVQEVQEGQEGQEVQEDQEVREVLEDQEVREGQEGQEVREGQEGQEVQEDQEVREGQEGQVQEGQGREIGRISRGE